VVKDISTVLLAGIGRGPFKAVAPVLERRHLKIEHITEPEDAVALACTKLFDLVIFDADPERLGLAELVGRLRTSGSASRCASLLVVARPGAAQEAGGLIGLGVNRVVTLDMSEEMIDRYVADLLDVAPRAAVRFKARLTTVLNDGTIEIIGRTANVSVTGMLLETATMLEIGQRVAFEFLASDADDMVSGEAKVVRHAVAERGGVDGIGLRFLALHGDGRERIEEILIRACVSS
jgi:DNA-binding response OmpR family regulator